VGTNHYILCLRSYLVSPFSEFSRRYSVELKQIKRGQALDHLRDGAVARRPTLLTGTKDSEISEAAVLARILNR